jgi:hypothetical protein
MFGGLEFWVNDKRKFLNEFGHEDGLRRIVVR